MGDLGAQLLDTFFQQPVGGAVGRAQGLHQLVSLGRKAGDGRRQLLALGLQLLAALLELHRQLVGDAHGQVQWLSENHPALAKQFIFITGGAL
ncbi:hypothetical protein S1OALGB6SA_1548 [Olavius algarvensis spirochete endosymbiont]|uniref:hypothetical protein n=1 Tax=Olavius algarvensis spirochete endosymbiont TaxID=260710 RepID=UPI000F142ABA|nr:hypothetical protein [Olavius algarvensis spirochete endosymbiont]VDB00466.1 hypothetical protein S1OALGB6SA_1548 [Olavius algarvensis spirochete endosymbiont]